MLFEPYEYIIQNPGKDIRTLLISAFNIWLKVPQDKVSALALSLPCALEHQDPPCQACKVGVRAGRKPRAKSAAKCEASESQSVFFASRWCRFAEAPVPRIDG